MPKNKATPHFSRKLLAIPYGLFLAVFVIVPLLIVVYYAFTNDDGEFTFKYIRLFFNENGNGFLGFFQSYNFKTILRSFFISCMSTIICLLIAYPIAYIIAHCQLKNKSALLLMFIVPMWVNFVLRINALKEFEKEFAKYAGKKAPTAKIFDKCIGRTSKVESELSA